jgi:hypothetical protein
MLLSLYQESHNGCSASRRGQRVTICLSRAVTIGSGLVDIVGTSRLGDTTAGISDPCSNLSYGVKVTVVCFSGGNEPMRHNLGAA